MTEEHIYASDDIRVIGDAISFIQKRPSSFVGDDPTGAYFVGRLVSDLILLDAGPLRSARIGSWYSVSADKDWLTSEGGVVSFEPFQRLIPIPSAGRLCDRAEVIIAALTDAVVTFGTDGMTWISGDPALWQLPRDLDLELSDRKGRTVAFHFAKFTTAEFANRRLG